MARLMSSATFGKSSTLRKKSGEAEIVYNFWHILYCHQYDGDAFSIATFQAQGTYTFAVQKTFAFFQFFPFLSLKKAVTRKKCFTFERTLKITRNVRLKYTKRYFEKRLLSYLTLGKNLPIITVNQTQFLVQKYVFIYFFSKSFINLRFTINILLYTP